MKRLVAKRARARSARQNRDIAARELPPRHPARRAAWRNKKRAAPLTKRGLFFGNPVTLACDGRCDKAWGINGRPRHWLSEEEDDYVFLADDEVGTSPPPGKTVILSEGGHLKPSATRLYARDAGRMNKWCARECERCKMAHEGQPIEVRDMASPKPNIPRSA